MNLFTPPGSTPTSTPPSARIPWLNVLRGLCSVWIVYYHLYTPFAVGLKGKLPPLDMNLIPALFARYTDFGLPEVLAAAATLHDLIATMSLHAVGVFIFMSGFGVTTSLLRRADRGTLSWRTWFWQRFLRLYPFLWFAHLAYLLGPFVWKIEGVDWRFLVSLTGVRAWPMDEMIYYANPSWWFFWLIVQLYLTLPLLFVAMRRCGEGVFLAASMLVTFLFRYYLLYHEGSNAVGYMLIGAVFVSRLGEFTMGMALAGLTHKHGHHILHQMGTRTATLLGMLLYTAGILCYWSTFSYIFLDVLATAGMVLLTARLAMLLSRFKWLRVMLSFAGAASLSTFLLHQPWAITIGLALHRQPAWLFAFWCLATVPGLVLISWACERAVKLVVDRLSRSEQPPATAPVPA